MAALLPPAHDGRTRSRIAVTGATGFLGRHLTATLAERGHVVTGLARRSAGPPAGASEMVIGDITDTDRLDRLVAGAEVVIHLVSNFRSAAGNAQSYWRTNVEGTRNALRAARKA